MPQIPLPPQISLPSWAPLTVAGGSLLLAALMLLWGWRIDRCVFALAGAGAGLALAGPLARWTAMPLPAAQISAPITLAILGFIFARLFWALLAAGSFGAAAVWFVTRHLLAGTPRGGPTFPEYADNLQAYCQAMSTFALDCIAFAWDRAPGLLLLSAGIATGLPLLICLVRPRLGRIFMSSLIGAGGVVLAGAALAALLAPSWRPVIWKPWLLPVAVGGALMLLGLGNQYRAAFAADRAEKGREAEPPKKSKSQPPDSAEKS